MVRPFYPAIAYVMQMSMRDTLAASAIIGVPKKGERANIVHCAARENFRALCNETDPFLTLIEEEGKGMDYLALTIGTPIALRIGKYDGERISRNDTYRQSLIQRTGLIEVQSYLFVVPDRRMARENMPIVTIGYTVADDHTEAGIPCWWIDTVALVRERVDGSELIENIAIFEKPIEIEMLPEQLSPRIVAKKLEVDELRRLASVAKRRIA